jgi:hypothetical protein
MAKEKEKSIIDIAHDYMQKKGIDPSSEVSAAELDSEPAQTEKAEDIQPMPEEAYIINKPVNEVLEDLLGNVKSKDTIIEVSLPSRGKAYNNHNGTVKIKPFTFEQEKKLRSIKKARQGRAIIKSLFDDCVEGLDYDSMTLFDKAYLLFKLREISYGDDYKIRGICEHCEAESELVLQISKVPVNYAPDDYQEPFKTTLPDSLQEVTFISPRGKDEDFVEDVDLLVDNLHQFVLSVSDHADKKIIEGFIKGTTAKDVATLREQIFKQRYGMDTTVTFGCASCGEDTQTTIPLNENFFSVS